VGIDRRKARLKKKAGVCTIPLDMGSKKNVVEQNTSGKGRKEGKEKTKKKTISDGNHCMVGKTLKIFSIKGTWKRRRKKRDFGEPIGRSEWEKKLKQGKRGKGAIQQEKLFLSGQQAMTGEYNPICGADGIDAVPLG